MSYSPKWSSFGAYLYRMLGAIQGHWDATLAESRTSPPAGTYVEIKYRMNSKGQLDGIVSVKSTSSRTGEANCLSAISMSAPFSKWTQEMVSMLGDSQEFTIRFDYK